MVTLCAILYKLGSGNVAFALKSFPILYLYRPNAFPYALVKFDFGYDDYANEFLLNSDVGIPHCILHNSTSSDWLLANGTLRMTYLS